MQKQPDLLQGLTASEVVEQRTLHGSNATIVKGNFLWETIRSTVLEPMFIILVATSVIYFVLGEFPEGFTMLGALVLVAGIDVFQNFRSQKAIKALNRITESKAKVVRDGITVEVNFADLVVGDLIVCEEGTIVPADAKIVTSNDFSINESILTGESLAVDKVADEQIFQGTLIVRGYCFAKVETVGNRTSLSEIGDLVANAGVEKTPLQLKVQRFVKIMLIAGAFAFLFVWIINWIISANLLHGLLHGLTMAMSIIPEEIPIALSTFMALGAYRLLKTGIIAKSPKTVETLGSATVICLDKTGTLTQNLMKVAFTFDAKTKQEVDFTQQAKASEVLEYAMWSSEKQAFDPMEISIHEQYTLLFPDDLRPQFQMVKEFPLSGTPPVMTHLFQNKEQQLVVACKGAVEGVLNLCKADENVIHQWQEQAKVYASNGLRVLGVAKGEWTKPGLPEAQNDCDFTFLGLIAFQDPIDAAIPEVIASFYKAGIEVKMITGDFPETALSIAKQAGIRATTAITGLEIADMSDEALDQIVMQNNVFARVKPDMKLRIVESLKRKQQIVSMTGDGVNDAPALKAAHIGIAMGKRGTEVAKSAAGLVLVKDQLASMVDAIYLGRRINLNLQKAFRYIISIHLPIILLVMLPIFLGWMPGMLFAPVHVIFLEIIMGPTCSIIYENEPTSLDEVRYPIPASNSLFTKRDLLVTLLQGALITLACVLTGFWSYQSGATAAEIRTTVFSCLVFSNVFLTLVNRSFEFTILHTLFYKNNLVPIIIGLSLVLLGLILYVPLLREIFELSYLPPKRLLVPLGLAFIFTMWVELTKLGKKGV